MKPRRVLIVSHVIPRFPGPGAETRAYCLARALSKEFKLTFLMPAHTPELKALLAELNALGQTDAATAQWTRLEWRLYQLRRLGEGWRPYNPLARRPEMVRQTEAALLGLRKCLATVRWDEFDLVHFIHPHSAGVLEQVKVPVPKTLDWIDERTNTMERALAGESKPAARWAIQLEIGRTRAYQKRIGRLFEAAFASSAMDADRLAGMGAGARPTIVPNGVDTSYFISQGQFGKRQTNQLLFSGHMGYEPNIDAILYFWREIWPLVSARIPGAHLMIAGTSPDEEVQRLGREHPEQVTVTGRVEDMRLHLSRASVCLAPLKNGSGTRLKVLEAMAMARPVVSTSIGCEGLAVRNGENILIADRPESFADAIARLLEQEALWKRVSENGRKLVVEQYDWEQLARPMARVWRELADRPEQ
jgi:glycosyltransferase involved in cell wall biosynthesis